MNRVTRITVAAIVAMWSLVTISTSTRVHAQASNGLHFERYGEVELRALAPQAAGERGGRRLKEFQHPHPAAFRRHKDLANEQRVTPLRSAPSSMPARCSCAVRSFPGGLTVSKRMSSWSSATGSAMG